MSCSAGCSMRLIQHTRLPACRASDDDFAPTQPMQEMIVNFLLRMCFVLGESKEKDLQVGLPCCSDMHRAL